jgi:hypothetical protein
VLTYKNIQHALGDVDSPEAYEAVRQRVADVLGSQIEESWQNVELAKQMLEDGH